MTDTSDYDDELEQDDEQPTRRVNPADLKRLREQAKEAEANRQRAEMAERKLALAESGLQLNPVQVKALLTIHEGEWSAESLQQTATGLGFLTPPPEPKEEIAAQNRMVQAASGADEAQRSADVMEELQRIDPRSPTRIQEVAEWYYKHNPNAHR